ncbi:SdpI family protein [Peptoniphilus porci]|uniref:DUF1648 domain-containing protein n=1 Tax=Peptoniphilus porci TaxID=2652280 RepID=A0A1U7M066_9FIRM|nr:SdpI family protein [Peptoniphilus porci]OLR64998.1 hypothetical protein BIV18_05455 [Peptoniphilus porci]
MKNKFRFRESSIYSIIASIIILIFFSAVFYNKMPRELPTHWNFNNEVDAYGSKFEAMIGVPLFLVAMNIFLCFMLDNDPKNRLQNNLLMTITKMTFPLMMIVIYVITVLYGLGREVNTSIIISLAIGILFVVIGNYMPKVKRNYTMGIKLPWTLNSDENWRRTHRIGGISFIMMGLTFFAYPFIKSEALIFGVVIFAIAIPTIYSFYLYTRGI